LTQPEVGRTSRGGAPRPTHRSRTIVVVIDGPIAPGDVPPLWERIRPLLECTDAEVVVCDVTALGDPDAVTIDALARLQLAARRCGRRVRVRHACAELKGLLDLMGLADVVPCVDGLPLEARGKAEQREQPPRVQEEGDPGDPAG
jgi:ABC-type transporter Mla MlaB component